MKRLQGKVALVTGASRGIGKGSPWGWVKRGQLSTALFARIHSEQGRLIAAIVSFWQQTPA